MKLKELTKEDLKFISSVYNSKDKWDNKMLSLTTKYGKSERTIRKWLVELGFKNKQDVEKSDQYKLAQKRKIDKTKKRFIVTWAQNNTDIHLDFFNNIKVYAEYINADIHVIAGRYRNPTSVFTDKEFDVWADEVLPYLDANRHNVHKYVSIMSDIKIQPTAVNPMSGMNGLSGVNSCVYGSPRVQMEMIPVLEGNKPKIMVTTGSVTKDNYTDSKSGKKGEFHHTYGFVVVEIKDDNTFYIRQVTANDKNGSFNDLFYNVTDKKVTVNKKIAGIILGDIHYGHHDEQVIRETHRLLDKLKPDNVVLHDVFDGKSISHHEMKDPFVQYSKEITNENSLEREVKIMLTGLKEFKKYKNVIIVRSNHDDFLDRWLKNEDWKKQPTSKNSLLYMEYSAMLLRQYAKGVVKGVIPEIINGAYPEFKTLGRSDSYKIKNWEVGQHGDVASNGSRGSLNNFRTLNTKIVVGHYHAPGRKDGAISVGTSTKLRVGYNIGASSWLQSHVIIHDDSRAQHINFINGGFTTFEF